jgi:hypothetical protein
MQNNFPSHAESNNNQTGTHPRMIGTTNSSSQNYRRAFKPNINNSLSQNGGSIAGISNSGAFSTLNSEAGQNQY